MNAEQRILAWLERADFNGTGCRWSQENIAAACGCSRRTVIRATQSLAAQGLITIGKESRPGCKWLCNVYRVKHWNPHKRSGVLNVLRSIQERRILASEATCHTDRTARPSRAQTPGGNPLLTASNVLPGRSRARARGENGLSRRTSVQEAARFHRPVAVPDLTCPRCQELAQEVEAKAEIIRRLSVDNTSLAEEVSGALETARAAGKEVTKLRRDLTRQQNESAKAEQVEKVVAHWRSHRPKASKAFGKPGSKSFKTIEAALVLMADDDAGAVGACCEAIDGLHLAPYQEFEKRYATDGPGRTLRNDVEHALGDESRIERCRAIARKAGNVSLDAKLRAFETSAQVHEAWSRALLGELFTPPAEPDDSIEVDGIVVRP